MLLQFRRCINRLLFDFWADMDRMVQYINLDSPDLRPVIPRQGPEQLFRMAHSVLGDPNGEWWRCEVQGVVIERQLGRHRVTK